MTDVFDVLLGARDLRTDVVVWPVEPFTVGKYGAHGAVRRSPADGLCGPVPGERSPDSLADERAIEAARYPCTHKGADLSAPKGTKVVCPKDGWILYLGPATSAPFVGYGPNVALIAHADREDSWFGKAWRWMNQPLWHMDNVPEKAVSLRYSLIAHFDMFPSIVKFPLANDVWNSTLAKPNPEHWQRLPGDRDTVAMMTDADAYNDEKRRIYAGTELGTIGDMGHIHWEIRTSPLAEKSRRFDPIEMWRVAYNTPLPAGSGVTRAAGGGSGWLLLLALLALGSRRRR